MSKRVSQVLSSMYNSHWLLWIYQYSIINYYTCMFGHTFYYTAFVDKELAVAIEAMHYFSITNTATIFIITFHATRSRFDRTFRSLSNVSYKYGDTIDYETAHEIKLLTETTRKRKKLISRALCGAYFFFGLSAVFLLPIIANRYSDPEKDDPVNRRAPLIKSTPYDSKNNDFGWSVSAICDFLIVFAVVSVLNAIDIPFVCFSEEGCNQLDILSLCLRRVFRRARYVHEKKFGCPVESYQDEKFSWCIKMCMNDSINHHAAVLRYFQDFTSAYSLPVLIVILSGAFLLCITGITFVSENLAIGMKVAFMLYLSGELSHTFVFAYYGERMSQTSSGLREDVYRIEWEECSSVLKPYLVVMQAYSNKTTISLSALGFIEYNLDNFGNVLRTAYSYFILLSVFAEI